MTNDNGHSTRLADLATGLLHMKRIAIIDDLNDYGVGARDIFVARLKELGLTPVDIESYQTNDKDFTAQLTHIGGAAPEGIALLGTLPAAPAIMNQARDLGIEGRFMGAAGLSNEAIMTLAPEASQHAIATAYFFPTLDDAARAWTTKYQAMFKGAAQAPGHPRPRHPTERRRWLPIAWPPPEPRRTPCGPCLKAWHGTFFGLPHADAHFDDNNQLIVPVVVETVEGKEFALLPGAN